MAKAKVYISDTLIIKALNTTAGSGGVARDLNKTTTRILQSAMARAPVNKVQNATHRGGRVGTYRRSFKQRRRGNGHILTRWVYNTAAHAIYVEKGRRSTAWGAEFFTGDGYHLGYTDRRTGVRMTFGGDEPEVLERFGWTKYGGKIQLYFGTGARDGRHILEQAHRKHTRKYVLNYARGAVR